MVFLVATIHCFNMVNLLNYLDEHPYPQRANCMFVSSSAGKWTDMELVFHRLCLYLRYIEASWYSLCSYVDSRSVLASLCLILLSVI